MSVLTQPTSSGWQVPPYPFYQMSVDEYHQMIQAGILTEDHPVELLEGWIVPKMARKPPHDGTVQFAMKRLGRRLPAGWELRGQSAITTGDSEPDPDLAVVRGDEGTYVNRHPGPEDIGLLIEVADTTLDRDPIDKGRIYARASIPRYWILNLIDRCVEEYTDPLGLDANPSYRLRRDYDLNASVPLVLDGQEIGLIPVRDLIRND